MNIAGISNLSSPASVAQLADLTAERGAPAHHKPLSGAALRNASAAEQRTAVAQQFEAILVRQLLNKTMTSMLGSEKSGPAANVYGDMLTDTFAQQLTAGSGLGFGKMLEKQLTPRGVSAAVSPTDQNSAEAHP
jgi:Rod binding domain-containing protein